MAYPIHRPSADGGAPHAGVKLFTQGQGIFDDRRQVAKFLGLSEDDVEVELVPNGGAFGGKEDMSIQAQTALLAKVTGRPVKLALTREESIRLHPKRHPIRMTYTVGCDASGKLTAVKADMLGDSGAYASVGAKVLERAAGHACGAYNVPHVYVEAKAAYTNNVPCGAFRGFGANQAQFAMEGAIDFLAEKLGRDAWDFRFQNALEVGSVFASGQVFEKSVGLKKTLHAIKPHYDAAKAAGKACGIACGIKNSGIGNGALEWGKVRLVVEPKDDTGCIPVSLYNGYTEMGQGLLTVLIQCAVEATGVPASHFRAKVDSTYQLGCGQTTGSRATLLGGRATVAAGKKLRADLDAGHSLADLVGKVYVGDELIDDTTALGNEPKAGKKIETAHGVRLCDAARHPRRRGKAREGVCRARRGARDQSGALRGAGRGVGAHGAGLRADRGAPLRRARPPRDELDARDRRPPREGHARHRGHPRRGARARGALWRQGRWGDRTRADRTGRRGRALRVRRRPSLHAADEGQPGGARDWGREDQGQGESMSVPPVALVGGTVVELSPPRCERADVVLAEGRIAQVGGELPALAVHVDASGCLVMPAFAVAHTHLYSALACGMPPAVPAPTSFVDILRRVWWRLNRALDLELVHTSALVGAVEAAKRGAAFVVDHHASPDAIDGSLDRIAEALDEVGVRGALCYETTDRGGPGKRKAGLRENERFLERAQGGASSHAALVGAHAPFTLEDETLDALRDLADRRRAGLHVHVAEDGTDAADARTRGTTLRARLDRLGVARPGSIVAHAVHLPGEGIDALTAAGAWIVTNPRSNMNNAVGLSSARGRHVALGTDGIGADMLAEAHAHFLRHAEARDGLASETVARLVASQRLASLLSGDGEREPRVAPGERADLVVLAYDPPTSMTAASLEGHALFGWTTALVRDTIVGGRFIVETGG